MKIEGSAGAWKLVGVVGVAVATAACGGSSAGHPGGGGATVDRGASADAPDAGAGAISEKHSDARAVSCMGVMEFINVFPRKGAAGSTIILVGLGLSGDMTIAFPGGSVAPMAALDSDMNVAFFTVPDGATDGALSVTCGSESASLGATWTLATDALPSVSNVAPLRVEPEGVLAVSGTGLAGSTLHLSSASTPIANTGTDTSATFVVPHKTQVLTMTTYRPILRGAYGAYLLPARFAIEVVAP